MDNFLISKVAGWQIKTYNIKLISVNKVKTLHFAFEELINSEYMWTISVVIF